MENRPHFDPERAAGSILGAIVQSSHDAIIVTDLKGVILSWSRGAERLYGYTADEVRGGSILPLIPNDRSSEYASILDRIRAGHPIEERETVRRTKDGRLLDVLLSVSPIRDAAGEIVGAVAVARDVTAHKRAELALNTSERRWRAVIDSAVDGIIVIDAKGTIQTFNPGAERMFGYTEKEVLGRNVNILMPAPYRDEHDEYIAHYLRTGHQKIIGIGREVAGRRRDGTIFPVHLSVGEMRIGSQRHFTGILHDLSSRVQLEERVREQNALARLGEMASVLAHEVKNPLAAVRSAIQVIGGRLPAGSKDAPVVREIVARLDALNDLMTDLLLFARTPQPRLAAVEIVSLLQLTGDLLSKDSAFSGVRMEITGASPQVQGDAELLKIVFQNLFINAAHAMQGQGLIRVSVTQIDGVQQIRVADTGPGIPDDVRNKLFKPFFTTKARGTGLGLSTAKRLVEAHAGTIDVECPAGGGTTVTVRLPA